MRPPKIEKHGKNYRYTWRCAGQVQRFTDPDPDIVLKAAVYVKAVGGNNICQTDPELTERRFVETAAFDEAIIQAEARRAVDRTFAGVAKAMIEDRYKKKTISFKTYRIYQRYVREDFAEWADWDVASFEREHVTDRHERFKTAVFEHNGKTVKGYSEKAANTRIGFAKGVLHYAYNKRLTSTDLFEGIKHERGGKRKREYRFVEREIWDQTVAFAKPEVRLMFDTLAETGMRISEAIGLQVKYVRFVKAAPFIDVQWQMDSETRQLVAPKSLSGGSVEISDELAADLREHVRGKSGDDFVFTTPTFHRPWWYRNLHKDWWTPMLQKAREAGVDVPQVLTFHDLRHSMGSWLLNAGYPMHAVQEKLRHKSIQTTIDIYGHVSVDVKRAMADFLKRKR
jgi:integrase